MSTTIGFTTKWKNPMMVILSAALLSAVAIRSFGWVPETHAELEWLLVVLVVALNAALVNGGTLIGPFGEEKVVWQQMWKQWARWTFGGVAIRYVILVGILYQKYGMMAFLYAALAVASDPLIAFIEDSLNKQKGPQEIVDTSVKRQESGSNDGLGAPILKVVLIGIATGILASITTMIISLVIALLLGLFRKALRRLIGGTATTVLSTVVVAILALLLEHEGIVFGYLTAWVAGYFSSGKMSHEEHVVSEELENIATYIIATICFSLLRFETMLDWTAFLATLGIFLGRWFQAMYEYPGDIRRQLSFAFVGTAGLAVITGAIIWCRIHDYDSSILEGITLWGFIYAIGSLIVSKGKH